MMYIQFMPPDKDELESFQIGLRSGVASSTRKSLAGEQFEISKDDFPNLSALVRSKATFKKKAGERVKSLKDAAKQEESDEEKARAEKARKAWENAMDLVSQLSIKE